MAILKLLLVLSLLYISPIFFPSKKKECNNFTIQFFFLINNNHNKRFNNNEHVDRIYNLFVTRIGKISTDSKIVEYITIV